MGSLRAQVLRRIQQLGQPIERLSSGSCRPARIHSQRGWLVPDAPVVAGGRALPFRLTHAEMSPTRNERGSPSAEIFL